MRRSPNLPLLLSAAQSAQLPDRLADSTWWRMVREMSEPGSYFRSENCLSRHARPGRPFYAALRRQRVLQPRRNLIIPLVGNFAGTRVLAAVGGWLRERGAWVHNTFYTSNVEQYLFQQSDEWSRFSANLAGISVDSAALFIRSVTTSRFGGQPSGFMHGAAHQPDCVARSGRRRRPGCR